MQQLPQAELFLQEFVGWSGKIRQISLRGSGEELGVSN